MSNNLPINISQRTIVPAVPVLAVPVLVVLLTFLTACTSTINKSENSSIGTITNSFGFPKVVRKNQTYILASYAKIYRGDVIKTDGDSVLRLQMTDKTTFDLGPNSHFVIHEYRHAVKSNSSMTRTSLISGSVRTNSPGIDLPGKMSYEIKTGLASIEAIDADFWSGYIFGDNTLDVVLLKGRELRLKNGHGDISIKDTGHGTTIFGDSAPQLPLKWLNSKIDRALSDISY